MSDCLECFGLGIITKGRRPKCDRCLGRTEEKILTREETKAAHSRRGGRKGGAVRAQQIKEGKL